MVFINQIRESLEIAKDFVLKGEEQILNGNLDENYRVSISPGATALASLALLALGRGFERPQRKAVDWLWRNQSATNQWGRFLDGPFDPEVTQLAQMAIQATHGGIIAKLSLLLYARQLSDVVFKFQEELVPGLEPPEPDEIILPRILEEKVLFKLPPYGRSAVVAGALLASRNEQQGIDGAINYLIQEQMADGSWAQDIVTTSLGILALVKYRKIHTLNRSGHWLIQKQYSSGGWPAFDQLYSWAVGWGLAIFNEFSKKNMREVRWMSNALEWLKKAQNADGSFGTTPPYTHPDLDDTAVALMGLKLCNGPEKVKTINLLNRLQNSDGSWGTFPSFQGQPPQINSCSPVYIRSMDVTIHVLEALTKTNQAEVVSKGLSWLLKNQEPSGKFPSVWFESSVYSTAQAVDLLSKYKGYWLKWKFNAAVAKANEQAIKYLLREQNDDGGWGTTTPECALTLAALLDSKYLAKTAKERIDLAAKRLLLYQNADGSFKPSYLGVYAKGWNYEEPLSTALTAIRSLQRYLRIYDR